ncbi:MAG: hypothetical protein EZS28_038187 [Streblomastix strix]|uniref:Uncharacterized protein n=1 Tax=Streblomastix strix TaxID=222440 RepID=A0A5J4U620_9EUKA|nr:MAG: hypothetical protein EZS28_038187 [Streblomastix strix]
MAQIISPRSSQASTPAIIEEDSPFEKKQYTSVDSPQQSRRRSTIFENELTADSSVCKWLLDIISEDEHTLKESAHFILSVPQLIRVVAYTFDVNEQQLQLNEDICTCCTRFMNDGTITLTEIRIGNVNIHALDENKVKLLKDIYKTEDDSLQLLKANDSDTYSKIKDDTLLLLKADKSELIDAYSQSENDVLLLQKANVADIVDSYSKTEDDALLLLKANVADIVDNYSKTEDNALLLMKTNVADIMDSYYNTDDDALLLLKANVVDIVDNYSKTEDDILLLLKVDKSDTYSKSEDDAILLLKADKSELIDAYSQSENDALLLQKANVSDIVGKL